jgi:hypothetical protein
MTNIRISRINHSNDEVYPAVVEINGIESSKEELLKAGFSISNGWFSHPKSQIKFNRLWTWQTCQSGNKYPGYSASHPCFHAPDWVQKFDI